MKQFVLSILLGVALLGTSLPVFAGATGRVSAVGGLPEGAFSHTVTGDARLDFEGLAEGEIVSNLSAGEEITGTIAVSSTLNAPVIFDATCEGGCTGDDEDLDFPEQGNVLIIAENLDDADGDGVVDDPDDADVQGAALTFDFSGLGGGAVAVLSLVAMDLGDNSDEFMDVDGIEAGGMVELFTGGPGGQLLGTVPIPRMGNNEKRMVHVGISGADYMRVTLAGSGAIDDINIQTAPPPLALGLAQVAEGFTSPVTMAEPPDGSGRLFIVDQVGQIWIVMPDGTMLDEPFLNIEDKLVELNPSYDERGLLGLAFHPNYAENGRFFIYYSAPLRPEAPDDFNHTNVVAEYAVSADDPSVADPESETILLYLDMPYSNHNAGTLLFGPDDGYLYISIGDGGNRDDEGIGHVPDWYEANAGGNGQDITENLLGSILRVDVDGGDPYAIPPDNPFVGTEALPEHYAYGLRNPYRMSFDMGGDHALFSQDAGQELWEEISIITSGGNYGWNVKEGTHCFDAENPTVPPETCPEVVGAGHPAEGDPLIDPIIELPNAKNPTGGFGVTIVGGHVYRGPTMRDLDGRYIFGVFSRGEIEVDEEELHFPGAIYVAVAHEEGLWDFQGVRLVTSPDGALDHFVKGFGQDQQGEVYLLTADMLGPTGNTGKVYRLVPPDSTALFASLTGENEVPGPGDPDGTGEAGITLRPDEGQVCFGISVSNIMLPATGAHIHEGTADVAGPVVVGFTPPDESGSSSGCVSADQALIEAIMANPAGYYVNVHTADFPAGAVRGQLSETPGDPPPDSPGSPSGPRQYGPSTRILIPVINLPPQ